MQYQSLQKQQAALQDLQNFLNAFTEQLEFQLKQYRNRVDRLHGDGLADEVYRTYLCNYYLPDENEIKRLINHMREVDAKYINKNLQEAGVNLNVAKGGFGGF